MGGELHKVDGGTGVSMTTDAINRRLVASEIWLEAQRVVMDEREAKGMPIFGLAASERDRIQTEVALVAGIHVANLALDHFMDTSSAVAQPGDING